MLNNFCRIYFGFLYIQTFLKQLFNLVQSLRDIHPFSDFFIFSRNYSESTLKFWSMILYLYSVLCRITPQAFMIFSGEIRSQHLMRILIDEWSSMSRLPV